MGATESTSRVFSQEIPNSAAPGYGPIRVSPDNFPIADHTCTLWDNFNVGLARSPNEPYLGTRSRDANGKAGAYTWITYSQAHERAQRIATGLQSLFKLQRQDMVGIFSKNRAEWIMSEIACNRMSYVVVPLYDTLGPKAIPFILNHTNMRVLVCSGDLVANVLQVKQECPSLEYIVSMDATITPRQRAEAESKGVTVFTLNEVENVPDATVPPSPPKPSDISTICYTSGTTGNPKGAILTHRNYTTAAMVLLHRIRCESHMIHISYLPLPHVMERCVTSIVARLGARIGFYQGDVLHLMDDMAELKPHLFVSVPRLFNRVYDKIIQGVSAAGGMKKLMFDYAYESKRSSLAETNVHTLWDALVFSKIQAVLGGRVEIIVSGSAPLSPNVKEFLKIAFSCRVEEGYGLTETGAATTLSFEDIPTGPHVGIPVANVQIRLADVPEMNYTSADKPRPRGEICIRGNNIFAGYYKEPEKTAECLSEDGWLSTGDVGAWNPDGTLSIIDRKKNIFKLSQGEYVAAEKIENIYAKSPFIAQIFLYGDSYQSCLVAIVVPDPEIVQAWATTNGISNDIVSLTKNNDLKAEIMKSMNELGKTAKLNGFECVKEIYLHPELFSIENDLITPTFKLKRPQLKSYFKNEIDAMYGNLK